ncbi:hypothetical protein Celaphus_00017874, partial [Cervus elaphus hippelaphus]
MQVYARMSEVLGITDDNHVLETFMTKIVTNLKYWGRCEPSEHFPFLGISDSYSLSDFRCRTTFYTALTRLLMVDLGKVKN